MVRSMALSNGGGHAKGGRRKSWLWGGLFFLIVLWVSSIGIVGAAVTVTPKAICPPYCPDDAIPSEKIDEPAEAAAYVLEFSGKPTSKFRGYCDLISASGLPDRITFKSGVPKSYKFTTPEIHCAFMKLDGRVRSVTLWRDGELVAELPRLPYRRWVHVWYKNGKTGTRGEPTPIMVK